MKKFFSFIIVLFLFQTSYGMQPEFKTLLIGLYKASSVEEWARTANSILKFDKKECNEIATALDKVDAYSYLKFGEYLHSKLRELGVEVYNDQYPELKNGFCYSHLNFDSFAVLVYNKTNVSAEQFLELCTPFEINMIDSFNQVYEKGNKESKNIVKRFFGWFF
ncbi:hypothetical protein KKA53_00380 [Candidatus Dependentiae bacterium]|nr:hypothetical protein [Candidatus Dependentiae bacterium]